MFMNGRSILAHVVSLTIALSLALIVGGFAGWAVGSTVGDWIEYFGITDAKSCGGQVGVVLGSVLCVGITVTSIVRNLRRP